MLGNVSKHVGEPAVAVPEELRALAESGLSEARRELETTGQAKPLFLFRVRGELVRHKMEEQFLDLMNDDDAKQAIFDMLREFRRVGDADGTVMVVDSWIGRLTDKFRREIESAPDAHRRAEEILGHKSVTQLAKEGWATRHEALCVTAQTATHVFVLTQFYTRHSKAGRIDWDERETACFHQEDFIGKMKMFGRED